MPDATANPSRAPAIDPTLLLDCCGRARRDGNRTCRFSLHAVCGDGHCRVIPCQFSQAPGLRAIVDSYWSAVTQCKRFLVARLLCHTVRLRRPPLAEGGPRCRLWRSFGSASWRFSNKECGLSKPSSSLAWGGGAGIIDSPALPQYLAVSAFGGERAIGRGAGMNV
jgi:hypothetical protein